MKKFILFLALSGLLLSQSAQAFHKGSATSASVASSQFVPNFLNSGEVPMVNSLKEFDGWDYSNFSTRAAPNELDANGYPLFGSAGLPGLSAQGNLPNQIERPGNYVLTYTGAGQTFGFDQNSSSTANAACFGVASGVSCDNSSCTQISGSITGNFLTVTGASSCSIILYLPISNGSTATNLFGVPTIITGMSGSPNCPSCTGTGGTGTYLVNFSQSTSGPFNPGNYLELTVGSAEVATSFVSWKVGINTVVNGNTIGHMAFVHKSDLATYASGQLVAPFFKQRIQQANFKTIRDLNWLVTNITNVTTWATRKPTAYVSYNMSEMRNTGYYAGVAGYALVGSSNNYSATLGSGGPVDKQTVCVRWNNTATTSTVTLNLNTSGALPIIDLQTNALTVGGSAPVAGNIAGLTYDATLNSWLSTGNFGARECLENGMPPEAFLQIASELGLKSTWNVEPFLASDPITDYMPQFAIYQHTNYPSIAPQWEIPNESWNCSGQGVGGYTSAKSRAYIAVDSLWASNASGHGFCGSSGDFNNWEGKAGSLLGQAIHSAFPSDIVIAGVQTVNGASFLSNDNILSTSYVGQNPSDIPIQSGCAGPGAIQTNCPSPFLQVAAYKKITHIAPANYWNVRLYKADQTFNNIGQPNNYGEVALGYCYFFQAAGCASQSSTMTTYMGTSGIIGTGTTIASLWNAWNNYAITCAGGSSCIQLGVLNYEGGYTTGGQGSDIQCAAATGCNPTVTSGTTTDITLANNGAFVGMSITIQSASGGTWSSVVGNTYQVTAVASGDFHISLNSTGLGTATALAFSYTGSANYVSYLRYNSYIAPDLQTLETLVYNTIASNTGACGTTPCSLSPSQFNLSSPPETNQDGWLTAGFDLNSFLPLAQCSSCTATGSNLTLAGTVSGIFTPGLTLMGGEVSTPTTITGACSKTGSGPAGSNAGDVCPLSATTTISTGSTVTANTTPTSSANVTVRSWQAICAWNGNATACP